MPTASVSAAATLSAELLARLACPACRGALKADAASVFCIECRRRYPVEDGIPVLIAERALQEG